MFEGYHNNETYEEHQHLHVRSYAIGYTTTTDRNNITLNRVNDDSFHKVNNSTHSTQQKDIIMIGKYTVTEQKKSVTFF